MKSGFKERRNEKKRFFLSVFSFSSVTIVFIRYYSPLRSRASLHYEAQSAQFFLIFNPYHPTKRNLYFVNGGGWRWCVDGGSRRWIYFHLSKFVSGVRLFSFFWKCFSQKTRTLFNFCEC